MCSNHPSISLGFTEQRFAAGVHICQIFSEESEREETLLKYLLGGLRDGERACCFSEKTRADVLCEYFGNHGIAYDEVEKSGAFALAPTRDIYFLNNRFDPDRMVDVLKQYHDDSVRQGYPAARVIGEMTAEIQHVPGGSRLLEYESKISLLLKTHPVTAMCQYDARDFDGAMIMDILKVHPYMIIRDSVVQNPFFIPPEEYLGSLTA